MLLRESDYRVSDGAVGQVGPGVGDDRAVEHIGPPQSTLVSLPFFTP